MHVRRDLEPAAERQFFQDVMHVAPDRIGGEMKLARDLLVAHPGRDQLDHLPLPLRQSYRLQRLALPPSYRQICNLREERDSQVRRENIGALGHRSNGMEEIV